MLNHVLFPVLCFQIKDWLFHPQQTLTYVGLGSIFQSKNKCIHLILWCLSSLQHGVNASSPSSNKSFSNHNQRKTCNCRSCCFYILFLNYDLLPSSPYKVYLQQSPAVASKVARQQCSHCLVFSCFTSIGLPIWAGSSRKMFPPSFLTSRQSGDLNKPHLYVKLAVVWCLYYCGESDMIMLWETYSAYQRFFAVLTVAHWHHFISPHHESAVS